MEAVVDSLVVRLKPKRFIVTLPRARRTLCPSWPVLAGLHLSKENRMKNAKFAIKAGSIGQEVVEES